ncbi:glycosyltransferase family 2 protein [Aureimonas leprariae]|nr:glycosyltransferase family 2 protein [Aureimonas leprariae]
MREQDHATGLPSIALPYGPNASNGKRDDDTIEVLSIPATDRVAADPLADVLACLGVDQVQYAAARYAAAVNGTDSAAELVAAGLIDEALLADTVAETLRLRRPDAPPPAIAEVGLAGSRRILRTAEPTPRVLIAPRLEDLVPVVDFLTAKPFLARQTEVASLRELDTARAEATRAERSDLARLSLSRDRLDLSARLTVTGSQGFVAALVLTGMLALVLFTWWGGVAAHLATLLLYLGCIALRFGAAIDLLRTSGGRRELIHVAACQERHPTYSVLVALRNEGPDTVGTLVEALDMLRWPRSKLQILLICEADDAATVAVVREAIRGRPCFRLEEVPPSHPRTKPKALNFTLPLATGEFVALFDAEDKPSPDQLLTAWAAFRAADASLACVQAPLVVTNGTKGWLPAHFALEYAALFFGLLPWLAERRMPLPLGGTSNHFRREALVAVGGWDSHNVTEDADLGMRFSRHGYRTGTIASPTCEEAPLRWRDWRNQRTRWMKGYAQTWLIHMRKPATLMRELGIRDFCVFQLLFAGMLLSSALNTVVLALLLRDLGGLLVHGWLGRTQGLLLALDGLVLVAGFGTYATLATLCSRRSGRTGILREIWTLPAYWLLVSLATLRALYQLWRAPQLWEKTPHGEAARRVRADERQRRPDTIPSIGAAVPLLER